MNSILTAILVSSIVFWVLGFVAGYERCMDDQEVIKQDEIPLD